MNRRSSTIFVSALYFLLVLALPGIAPALAAPGQIDPTFDPGSGIDGGVSDLRVQHDGKILVTGGFSTVKGLVRDGFARLHTDGSGDSSFAPEIPTNIFIASVLQQPDAKLLLAGYHRFTHAGYLARVDLNGGFDPAFRVRGQTADQLDIFTIAGLQPDGRILALGRFKSDGTGTAMRLTSTGEFDSSFQNLRVTGYIRAAALQKDGRILIGGEFVLPDSPPHTNLARLNPNGSVDTSFRAYPNFATNKWVTALALQSNGWILVATSDGPLRRLKPDGSLDTTFNTEAEFRSGSYIVKVLVEPDGRILLADGNRALHLNEDGTLNNIFSAELASVNAVAPQPGGDVLIGGSFKRAGGLQRINLARLRRDGTADPAFDPGAGIVGEISSILLQPDGRLLVAGTSLIVPDTPNSTPLARLRSNGTVDPDFKADVRYFRFPVPPPPARADGTRQSSFAFPGQTNLVEMPASIPNVALRPSGKILISGAFSKVSGADRGGIAQLNRDGSLDVNFNPGRF